MASMSDGDVVFVAANVPLLYAATSLPGPCMSPEVGGSWTMTLIAGERP
jgi:hypothetical protein